MRRDDLYLADMLDAANAIGRFLSGRDEAALLQDDMLRSAVMHKLIIIGEAATNLSKLLRDRNPAIPWRNVVAFRNIAAHQYFGIDWQIVWKTATQDVPALTAQIEAIVAHSKESDQ